MKTHLPQYRSPTADQTQPSDATATGEMEQKYIELLERLTVALERVLNKSAGGSEMVYQVLTLMGPI